MPAETLDLIVALLAIAVSGGMLGVLAWRGRDRLKKATADAERSLQDSLDH